MRYSITIIALSGMVIACAPQVPNLASSEQALTAGLVQKEIYTGMAADGVASALGSPNIVTRDEDGKSTWIYDRIATEATYSKSSTGLAAGGAGISPVGTSLILSLIGGNYQRQRSESSSVQRTFTVIIRFDGQDKVETTTFHATRF